MVKQPLYVQEHMQYMLNQWGKNGMLRNAFERLEGSNILWQIVGPSPPVPPIFTLFLRLFQPL